MISDFSILILIHFISDWFFQIHSWAVEKTKNYKARLLHCLQYTVFFIPVFYFLNINYSWLLWIFGTHFLIDDRKFLIWWNKSIKRAQNPLDWIIIVQDQVLHILVLVPLLYFKNFF